MCLEGSRLPIPTRAAPHRCLVAELRRSPPARGPSSGRRLPCGPGGSRRAPLPGSRFWPLATPVASQPVRARPTDESPAVRAHARSRPTSPCCPVSSPFDCNREMRPRPTSVAHIPGSTSAPNRKPAVSSASCSSSASRGSGRTSSHTRSIADLSSAPMSDALARTRLV